MPSYTFTNANHIVSDFCEDLDGTTGCIGQTSGNVTFSAQQSHNSTKTLYAKWAQCGAGSYINGASCVSCDDDGYYCEGGVRKACENSFNHSGRFNGANYITGSRQAATDCYVTATKACGTNGCFTLSGNANTLRYWTNHSSDKEIAGLARNDSGGGG